MFLTIILHVLKVVDEYNRREQEIKHLEKELDEKSNDLSSYRQNISEVVIRHCRESPGLIVL